MVAQAAVEVKAAQPAGPGRLRVSLALACGCTVEQEIAADRLLVREDGSRFAVGKYRCPRGHPAGPPR